MARGTPVHYIKPSHDGRLRAETHTKTGHDIPEKTLEKDAHSSSPKLREQANFAINARHWDHGK